MLNGRRFHSLCFLVVLAGASLLARRARADGFVNFDDLPNNTMVRYQYVAVGGSGLQFTGDTHLFGGGTHILTNLVAPHSGSNVLISSSLDDEFAGVPLKGTFQQPQQTVSLWGGYFKFNSSPATHQGTLSVFDQGGNVITSVTHTVTGNQSSTSFSVTSPVGANIYSFKLDVGANVYTTIDDLQFSGGTPVTPPNGPPVVHITDPQQSGFVDTTNSTLLVDGSVTGDNLLPELMIELRLQSAPPSPNFPLVQLTSMTLGAGQTFGAQLFPNLLMGVYQLTVTATNVAGVTGSAVVTFTNLPPSLRQPDFQYAVPAGNCEIAKFADGAKAFFPATGVTRAIREDIFAKWVTVKSYPILRHDGTLGCPLQIALPVLKFLDASNFIVLGWLQDFERGRIYAMTGSPAFYTPTVFVDAITAISTYTLSPIGNPPRSFNDPFGVDEVGVPGSDPVTYISGNDPTWLFQRFTRPNFPSTEPSTLEIRGRNPNPNLYIERIGGGMVDFTHGTHLSTPADITPAAWDVFPCIFNNQDEGWTCGVTRPHLQSVSASGVPLYTTESQVKDDMEFCDHNVPYCVFDHACPQWSAVPTTMDEMGVTHKPLTDPFGQNFQLGNLKEENTPSDHVDVQTIGWVQSSNAAGEDMSWDHWNMQGRRLPGILGDLCSDALTLAGCGALECGAGNSIGDKLCGGWADWGFHIRPIAQWVPDPNLDHLRKPNPLAPIPPFWNLLASTASPDNDIHLGTPNPLNNQGSSGDMEIEWEAAWGNNFINAGMVPQPGGTNEHGFWGGTLAEPPPPPQPVFNWPRVGSLAFVNGRWMLDCGHVVLQTDHHFHSEIHPINTLITSESSPAPADMHLLTRVTKAQVWVNQLYEGKPFQTKVWAPPRPSPQAELSALFVNYNGPGGGGTVHNPDGSFAFSFTNYPAGNPATVSPVASTVTAAFTGDGLSVSVSGPAGSHGIEWQSGQPFYPGDHYANGSGAVGEFIGRWYVGWSCLTIKVLGQFIYTCNFPAP